MVRIQLLGLSVQVTRWEQLMKKSVKVILCLFGMYSNASFTCRTQASRGHRRLEVMNLGKGCRVRGASVGKHLIVLNLMH